jgi:hypothetical protein
MNAGGTPSDTLRAILATYKLERDLMKIASRALAGKDTSLFVSTEFVGRTGAEAAEDIRRLGERLDEMTIVAIWSIFERYVIDRVRGLLSVKPSTPTDLINAMNEYVEKTIEYARVDDLLHAHASGSKPGRRSRSSVNSMSWPSSGKTSAKSSSVSW